MAGHGQRELDWDLVFLGHPFWVESFKGDANEGPGVLNFNRLVDCWSVPSERGSGALLVGAFPL